MAFDATKLPHEEAGVRTGRVLLLVFGFIFFAGALTGILYAYFRASVVPSAVVEPMQRFPAPRLQPHPNADYRAFLKAQRDELAGTRWVDRQKNLIHIPIERAMAYVATRGAAAYDPLDATAKHAPAPDSCPKQNKMPPFSTVAPKETPR